MKSKECLVGEFYKNNAGYEFEIIEVLPKNKRKIKFVQSGYERINCTKEIKNGVIKDWLSPCVCGKGIVGIEIEKPQSHYLYDRWRDMIRRCYDEKSRMYYSYGSKGVTVSEEWLYFPTFVKDMESKDNCDKLREKNGTWQIDKDLLSGENKIYSNETTCIIERSENIKERNKRHDYNRKYNNKKIHQFDLDGNFINTWESATEASKSLNVSFNCITECTNGTSLTYNNFIWIKEIMFPTIKEAQLEVDKIIDIKNNKRKGVRNNERYSS